MFVVLEKTGFDALKYVVHHPQLMHIPKILETPFIGSDAKNKKAPYKQEIAMLREGTFKPENLDELRN